MADTANSINRRWRAGVWPCALLCLVVSVVTSPFTVAEQTRVFQLPVRIHAISSQIPPLHATLSDAQIQALMLRVNQIWQGAGIEWQLQSIERHTLANESQVIAGLRGQAPFSANDLLGAILSGQRDARVWQVYLVSDLTALIGVPGVYVPRIQSLASSERDPSGENDPGRILAHELGHSLTLDHVACTPSGNLMSPGCAAANRTRLTPAQIAAARRQAAWGRAHQTGAFR